jgi:hypothetical protein
MKDFLGACLLGAVLGAMFAYGVPAKAQTYSVQNAQGYVQGYIQQNGNTVNVLNANGNQIAPPLTVQPTQLTAPSGYAIGTPSYTVPMSPPSPPSPRVLQ